MTTAPTAPPRLFRFGLGPDRRFLWLTCGPLYVGVALYWGWTRRHWRCWVWWGSPGNSPVWHAGPVTVTFWRGK